MRAELNIPPEKLSALSSLRDLGADGLDNLAAQLNAQGVLLYLEELENALAPVVGGHAQELAEVLVGLTVLLRKEDASPRILDALDATLRLHAEAMDPPWTPRDLDAWTALRQAVERLLQSEPIVTVGKAIELHLAHANIFDEVQIITDVRPVLDSSAGRTLASIITHQLSLQYFENGESRRLLLALDHKDLLKLVKTGERALRKEQIVRDTFKDLPVRTEVWGASEE